MPLFISDRLNCCTFQGQLCDAGCWQFCDHGGNPNLPPIPQNPKGPFGLHSSNYCGMFELRCPSGNTYFAPVYSHGLHPMIMLGSGCVTTPDGISCTGSCVGIKNLIGSCTRPILDHEGCHYCAFRDRGLCAYIATAGPAPGGCVGNVVQSRPYF